MTATTWSLDPLLHSVLPDKIADSIFTRLTFGGFFGMALLLSATYPLLHKLLLKSFENYKDIATPKKQIVSLHHALEALVLSIAFPFFTYYMISINFQVHELDDIVSNLRSILILCSTFMSMYMMELASRYEDPRPLIVFHHLLACADGLISFMFPTTFMIKTGSALVYFICFEAITFAGLFMYRMFPNSKNTSKVIFAGMVIFGGSRPLQLLWIGAVSFGSIKNDEHVVKWQVIMQITVTAILTVLQLFTLKVHYVIWKRCISNNKNKETQACITEKSTNDVIVTEKELEQQGTQLAVRQLSTESTKSFALISCDNDEESAVASGDTKA